MRSALSLGLSGLVCLSVVVLSCSESTPAPLLPPAAVDGGGSDAGSAFAAPSVPCTDAADAVYGDPGPLTADDNARGNIVKCTADPALTKDDMQAKLSALGYAGKPLTSSAHVFRVSYRTERGDAAKTPVAASAIVYTPDTPRADKAPIIVASHGSRGQAPKCAASKLDPSLEDINGDFWRMAYALVGHGYPVILPDLAGYANPGAPGNPESAYAQAADVARSTLDGARAMKKLFPSLDDKLVLVGHSQGGHTALSALALAGDYGTPAPIIGVAVYAPLWLSQRTWGALLYPIGSVQVPLASSAAGNVSVWYHYTQAELLDGPGEGKKLFKADKQEAIESFAKNECWGSTALTTLGAKLAPELYDSAFVTSIGTAAATGTACQTGDATCAKRIARYSADRPHITGDAAQVPIFIAYGMKDDTLVPNRMRCAIDRLKEDKTKLTVCVDADPGHQTIVSTRGDYVADWIGNLALGEPAPPACATNESALTETCATPPPND
jgi:pimeloyl-ACP methyl ester carboxylesterase